MKTILNYIVISSFLFLLTNCDFFGGEYKGHKPNPNPTPAERITHCCSSGAPNGYIKIDAKYNPNCGGGGSINTTPTSNRCTFQRYDNKKIGAQMTVCKGAIPVGWVMIKEMKDLSKCGSNPLFSNVMVIRKVN